ncbi:MAG TPA: hypothetical protein VHZ24_04480 [Pirellulales bacterium]|jgi:CheY-like chemotaxis protein|nr:hypothetical protein [Pirellulales bacterium]
MSAGGTSSPAAILVTGDLMFASRVTAAGQRTGVPVAIALGIDALGEQLAEGAPKLVVLDLTTPRLDVSTVVERLRAAQGAVPTVIAFGPHVQEQMLAQATAAGCDRVLARGQFNAQMDDLLRRYAGG